MSPTTAPSDRDALPRRLAPAAPGHSRVVPLARDDARLLRRAGAWALVALGLAVLLGCGGGGGGGSDDPAGAPGADAVVFEGIAFRTPSGALVDTPPVEAPDAVPPSLGAPLDQVVVFRFSGVPEGPFDASTLPVFTTPELADPSLGVPAGQAVVLAKGSYVRVDNLVEFRPFVPTAPLLLNLAAPPESVPGLLPGSTYVARVNAAPDAQLANLSGPGGEVHFGTTSNPAAYYPAGGADPAPPRVLASDPVDGATGFSPNPFGSSALATGAPLVPAGPESVVLHYDRALAPTAANLLGADLDGDGLLEPTFFAAARSGPLLVGHEVPAGALGAHDAFAALSGLAEGAPAAPDGADLLVHAGPAALGLGTREPALPGAPRSLVVAQEPALAFAAFARAGESDLLGVFGPVLGDASFARLGTLDDGVTPALFDTGLQELTGLVRLRSGRLLGLDRATGRVHELRPTATPRPGDVDAPGPAAPRFSALQVGDGGAAGFVGEPLQNPLLGGPLDALDLAVAPSGRLTALARLSPGAHPSLVRLTPVDRAGGGDLDPAGAQFLGAPGDVLATFAEDYVDVVFVGEHELLALDAVHDRIDRVDLASGTVVSVVPEVAGFGLAPSGAPPARCLAVGELQLELGAELLANDADGEELRLSPRGVLPLGAELRILQRNTLEALTGQTEFNSSLPADTTAFGARELLRVETSFPAAGEHAPLADVFEEHFVDDLFEAAAPAGPHPAAEWAEPLVSGGGASGFLRAARGVTDLAELGDFVPSPAAGFVPSLAYAPNTQQNGEPVLGLPGGGFHEILLNTDAQPLPLADGSTPGVTQAVVVSDGVFVFRDILIPAGVRVIARGSNPLVLIATGEVRIDGMIDVSGTEGSSDDSFNSAFIPVRGGPGGPGGGRGGDGHPTRFDPAGPGSIDQYVTPERGERGLGPVIQPGGAVVMQHVGGHGGLSTVGYTPFSDMPESYTVVNDMSNSEHSRPPGGGGGSMLRRGQPSRPGSGAYLVESEGGFPFQNCPTDDKIHDALYGNEENLARGLLPNKPLQCVHFTGDFPAADAVKPGAAPGDAVFADGDPSNDYIGPGGELPVLTGGQGGGGGGSRVDSLDHTLWSTDNLGSPAFTGPPFYPALFFGTFASPTLFDAKGAGGGGGGGGLLIRSYGDIVIGRQGYLDAAGGHGGGGEGVRNSSFTGGGGGGSGGAVVLQAAGALRFEADAGHDNAGYIDPDGDLGAHVEVSGGFGRDARTAPGNVGILTPFTHDHTRSDGGSGGHGLIQLQAGANEGVPQVDEGAFLFARQRATLKLGAWTGDPAFLQLEHFSFVQGSAFNPPDQLRYIDMLHHRSFRPFGLQGPQNRYYVLNGSFPPIIPSDDGDNGQGFVNEWPEGSGALWADTRMLPHPDQPGAWLVEEPEPGKVMKTYNGWDADFKEINNPPDHPLFPFSPGETYAFERVPLSELVEEPSGRPRFLEVDGEQVLDPANVFATLPVVPLEVAPPVISAVTTGTSDWLDFGGAVLRPRDALGRTPPFFAPVHGTWNPGVGLVPAGKDGHVVLGGKVPGQPARYVSKAGGFPLDPGLFGNPGDPPFNDIAVDSFDLPFPTQDALTDNAAVVLRFQGARPVRAGSRVPDGSTLSPWVSDLTALDGYPLVRFQVLFDLGAAPDAYPFDETSFRPSVDRVRLRMDY